MISTIKVVSLLPFKSTVDLLTAFSENTCCLANTNPMNYVYNAMCKNSAPFASRSICISEGITERTTADSVSSIISSYHHSFPTHLGYNQQTAWYFAQILIKMLIYLVLFLWSCDSSVRQDSDRGKLDAGGQDTLPHEITGRAVFLDDIFNLQNLHWPMVYFAFFWRLMVVFQFSGYFITGLLTSFH